MRFYPLSVSGSQALPILLPQKPLDCPLYPVPIASALIWVCLLLLGHPSMSTLCPHLCPHLRPHHIYVGVKPRSMQYIPALLPNARECLRGCSLLHALSRQCRRGDGLPCFSEGVGIYMPQLFPAVGRITEAHRLHKSPRSQWNKAPVPHGGLIKAHLSASSLPPFPASSPTPLRGFPAIASLRRGLH